MAMQALGLLSDVLCSQPDRDVPGSPTTVTNSGRPWQYGNAASALLIQVLCSRPDRDLPGSIQRGHSRLSQTAGGRGNVACNLWTTQRGAPLPLPPDPRGAEKRYGVSRHQVRRRGLGMINVFRLSQPDTHTHAPLAVLVVRRQRRRSSFASPARGL